MRTLVPGGGAAEAWSCWCWAIAWAGDPVNPNLSLEGRQVFGHWHVGEDSAWIGKRKTSTGSLLRGATR